MPTNIEAAFHEAAHAVIAHTSRYFALAGTVSIQNAGTGFAEIILSKRKLASASKAVDASVERDPQVAEEMAVILLAGLEGEVIAEEKNPSLRADADRSEPDITFAVEMLEAASVTTDLGVFRSKARARLEENWVIVEKVAQQLVTNRSLLAVDVVALLDEV